MINLQKFRRINTKSPLKNEKRTKNNPNVQKDLHNIFEESEYSFTLIKKIEVNILLHNSLQILCRSENSST